MACYKQAFELPFSAVRQIDEHVCNQVWFQVANAILVQVQEALR